MAEFYILLRAGAPDIASHILSNFYNETRPEYYRQIDRANKSRDLSAFIAYAVQGLRDGLLKTLRTVQENQFEITWWRLIYDRFAERKYNKKSVFVRQRELALALPLEGTLTADAIALLTPKIAQEYGRLSIRTLHRDIGELEQMGIVRKEMSQLLRVAPPAATRPATASPTVNAQPLAGPSSAAAPPSVEAGFASQAARHIDVTACTAERDMSVKRGAAPPLCPARGW